jgi:hypothetical protein
MTAPLQVGGIYEVRSWILQAEQAAVNTVHFLVLATSGAVPNDTDLARVYEVQTEALYKGMLSTDTSYRGVQVTLKTPAANTSPPATVFSNAFVGPGSLAPPDCPRQSAGLIHWSTPLGGRRNRGRLYIPFPPVAEVATNGTPSTTYMTALSNLATAHINFVTVNNVGSTGTATVDLVIYHRTKFGQPSITPTPITGFIVPAKFATQRRRGSYGRPNSSPL